MLQFFIPAGAETGELGSECVVLNQSTSVIIIFLIKIGQFTVSER